MMKKYLIPALLLLSSGQVLGQQHLPQRPICGYELVWKNLEQRIPNFREKYDNYTKVESEDVGSARPTGTVYDIPVVFHVVYYENGSVTKGNIDDSVLINQIEVLNAAYRKTHADTGNLRAPFKPLSVDAEIQFHLATIDPEGNPTSGITRTATTIEYFGDMGVMQGDISPIERIKKTSEGGQDPWNTRRYLNIWVADMSLDFGGQAMPAIMGIATPPLNPAPAVWDSADIQGLDQMIDGVIIQFQVVGNNNPYISDFASMGVGANGRTAVHEVGHYLGLRHIWGDPQSGEACTPAGDDGIDDTPAQAEQTDMALNPPSDTQNTCGATDSSDLPDLWENYMDYSKDDFQSMFTFGQVELMRGVCGDQRDSLFQTSTPPDPPTGIDVAETQEKTLMIYPQPASKNVKLDFKGKIERILIVNTLGRTVLELDGAKANSGNIDVSRLPSGSFYLKVISNGRAYNKKLIILH